MIPIYIGTYTDGASKGIYRLELDHVTARLSAPVLVAEAVNPSFLAWHPARPVLYAVSETGAAGESGALLAYRVGADGSLSPINAEPSGGAGACFVSVNPTGTHAFVANYTAGTVAVFPIREDGGVAPVSTLVQHTGSGAHPARQQGPRAHAIRVAPGGVFVMAADLGADRLFVYRFDARRGSLMPNDPPAAAAPPGSGPRHFTWDLSGDAVFVINELSSTIATYAWDGTRGILELRSAVSTLADGFAGENTTAEVAVHPSGRFVYGSNRGHDSIAAFSVASDCTLTRLGLYTTGGKTPRSFSIDPSGELLLAANQESDSLVLFHIDQQTGALVETGVQVAVPSPAFVHMPRVAVGSL